MRKGSFLSIVFALLWWGTLLVQPVWAADNAQFSSQRVPTVMIPGQSYFVWIYMKNTGNTTWTAAAQYKLGSQNPQDNLTWGVNRALLSVCGTSAPPDYTTCFAFSVTAPTTPGVYNFQWRMIHEGVGWFGELTPNIPIVVTPGGTSACDEGCRNSSTLNPSGPTTGSYWVARANQNQSISVFVNGSTANVPQPGGSTANVPAIEGFGSKVFLAVRGLSANEVWVNIWNGISWSGWVHNGETLNSPDLVVFNNTLFLAVVGTFHEMYVNRYTTSWLGWQNLGGYLNDAQICADTSQIRVGGTGYFGDCYRRKSGNGSFWDSWEIAPPCP